MKVPKLQKVHKEAIQIPSTVGVILVQISFQVVTVDVVLTMALSAYHGSCIRKVKEMFIIKKKGGIEGNQFQLIHQKLPVRCAMMIFDLKLVSKKCLHFSANTSSVMAALVRI